MARVPGSGEIKVVSPDSVHYRFSLIFSPPDSPSLSLPNSLSIYTPSTDGEAMRSALTTGFYKNVRLGCGETDARPLTSG